MTGSNPKKWDRTRVITQIGDNDQYLVRVNGSRRVTLRNRQHLRRYTGYETRHRGLMGVNRLVSRDNSPRQHPAMHPDGTTARGRMGRTGEEPARQPLDEGGAPWVHSQPMGLRSSLPGATQMGQFDTMMPGSPIEAPDSNHSHGESPMDDSWACTPGSLDMPRPRRPEE
jgi:hypothetical protein